LYLEEEATVLVVELEQQEEKEQLPLMSSKNQGDGIAFRGRSYRLNE
jgi:hypothetical protein